MANLLDGKELAEKAREQVRLRIHDERARPVLVSIIVGNNPGSELYVALKQKACSEAGIHSRTVRFEETSSQAEILGTIESLNQDDEVDGILLQLPLPVGFDTLRILSAIRPEKDVDGLHPLNLGKLSCGDETLVACTPKGIVRMLEHYGIGFGGKRVTVVNHSTVVGRPLCQMFLNRGATVTVCHVRTERLRDHTTCSDILVTATGVPGLITEDMVREKSVVVDGGINRSAEGKMRGDVDFEKVQDKVAWISPVPGGVGPMTVAMLLENCLEIHLRRKGLLR